MKKLLYAFIFLLLVSSSVYSQATLHFRFANPRILYTVNNTTGLSSQNLEWDVETYASIANTKYFALQVIMTYNSAALINPDFTQDILSTGNYTFSINNNSGHLNLTITSTKPSNSVNTTLFTTNPTSYTRIGTLRAEITDPSAVAGIQFMPVNMDGFQLEKVFTPTPGSRPYATPNIYEGTDLTNLYLGRVYSLTSGWSQYGGATLDVPFIDWTAPPVNTSVWDGAATIPAGSLLTASNLRIHNPATLTIPSTGQLTITGDAEINTPSGLTIQSDVANTGSLITATTSGTGSASVQRYMAAASWRIATSPVAGQTVGAFLTANGNVATGNGARGMADYAMGTDTWNPFFTNSEATTISIGKGYMLRASSAAAMPVTFNGTLNPATTNLTLATTGNGWNCVGNPFTSAITTATVISNNFAAFATGFASLYVYNGTSYDIENLANGPLTVQSGQGFFVKAAAPSSFAISASLKVHDNGAVLKSGDLSSEIKLIVRNDDKSASTLIKFMDGTTKGLDEGYDAGIFKSDIGLDLYTRLVEDCGIDFGLQCLPENDLNTMIIPVGIDSKAGGEVEFSAELMNLPSDCKVILEDKQNKTFTDLSENDYTTSVEAGSSISTRFQIHTSYQTTGIDGSNLTGKLSAYAVRNTEIRVKGQVSSQAVATLYDVQGRAIVVKNLEVGNLNMIPTPNLHTGIYMLSVKDNGRIQGFKIPVRE